MHGATGILHLMIKNDWIDHSFIENHTVGFDQVAASVEEWTLARTAQITGIAEKGILQAAEWWGRAKTSFLMHARGIEHSSHGVQSVFGRDKHCLANHLRPAVLVTGLSVRHVHCCNLRFRECHWDPFSADHSPYCCLYRDVSLVDHVRCYAFQAWKLLSFLWTT